MSLPCPTIFVSPWHKQVATSSPWAPPPPHQLASLHLPTVLHLPQFQHLLSAAGPSEVSKSTTPNPNFHPSNPVPTPARPQVHTSGLPNSHPSSHPGLGHAVVGSVQPTLRQPPATSVWRSGDGDSRRDVALLFFSIFVKHTQGRGDSLNKRDLWAMYYATIPHHLWLDHRWLGRALVDYGISKENGALGKRKVNSENQIFSGNAQKENPNGDGNPKTFPLRRSAFEAEGGDPYDGNGRQRSRDFIQGFLLMTNIAGLDETSWGKEFKQWCMQQGVDLQPEVFEERRRNISACISLYYTGLCLPEFRAAKVCLLDMLCTKLGLAQIVDLDAICALVHDKTLLCWQGEPLVRYRQTHYIPAKLVEHEGSLDIHFDLFGGMLFDTSQSQCAGRVITLAFKPGIPALQRHAINPILHDKRCEVNILDLGLSFIDKVLMQVLIPVSHDEHEVRYTMLEERLILHLYPKRPTACRTCMLASSSSNSLVLGNTRRSAERRCQSWTYPQALQNHNPDASQGHLPSAPVPALLDMVPLLLDFFEKRDQHSGESDLYDSGDESSDSSVVAL